MLFSCLGYDYDVPGRVVAESVVNEIQMYGRQRKFHVE